jgi:histidine ammonia-lyase
MSCAVCGCWFEVSLRATVGQCKETAKPAGEDEQTKKSSQEHKHSVGCTQQKFILWAWKGHRHLTALQLLGVAACTQLTQPARSP